MLPNLALLLLKPTVGVASVSFRTRERHWISVVLPALSSPSMITVCSAAAGPLAEAAEGLKSRVMKPTLGGFGALLSGATRALLLNQPMAARRDGLDAVERGTSLENAAVGEDGREGRRLLKKIQGVPSR